MLPLLLCTAGGLALNAGFLYKQPLLAVLAGMIFAAAIHIHART